MSRPCGGRPGRLRSGSAPFALRGSAAARPGFLRLNKTKILLYLCGARGVWAAFVSCSARGRRRRPPALLLRAGGAHARRVGLRPPWWPCGAGVLVVQGEHLHFGEQLQTRPPPDAGATAGIWSCCSCDPAPASRISKTKRTRHNGKSFITQLLPLFCCPYFARYS